MASKLKLIEKDIMHKKRTHIRYRKENHRQDGFSLIELLVIMAIVAIVVSLIGTSMRNLVLTTQIEEAKTQFISDLTRAKTASIRYSSPVTVTLNEDSYTLTQQNPFSEQTISVRNGAKLSFYNGSGFSTSTTSITYNNPYGEVTLPPGTQGWQIRIAKGDRDYYVKIIGLTGKVIVNNEL